MLSKVSKLWDCVNIPESHRLLVLTWLLDSLRPDTPFPLLELIGEQGSAKSLTQELLRTLIDPSTLTLRSAPKNADDVYIGAANGYLLGYDNISHLSADMQDTLPSPRPVHGAQVLTVMATPQHGSCRCRRA